jgi:hypothetical protein
MRMERQQGWVQSTVLGMRHTLQPAQSLRALVHEHLSGLKAEPEPRCPWYPTPAYASRAP